MKPCVPLAPRLSPVTATIVMVCVRGSPFGLVIRRTLGSTRSVTYRLPSGPSAMPFGLRVRTSASGVMAVAMAPPSGSGTIVSVAGSKVRRQTAVLFTALSGT